MSTRERWIVYPLIFLTLGIALRDKLLYRVRTDELRAKRIVCDQLQAENVSAVKMVRTHQFDCQTLIVHGPNGVPVVVAGADSATQNGLVETFSARGTPQVRLQTNEGSGVVTTIDQSGKTVTLGCLGEAPGVFLYLPDRKIFVPLTPNVVSTPTEPTPNASKPAANSAQPTPPKSQTKPLQTDHTP